MNRTFRMAFIAAVALAAQIACAGEIALYPGIGFQGEPFATTGAIANLQNQGFNDRAQSAIVKGGAWQLCTEPFFLGRCITLGPGTYHALSLAGMDDRVSSVREVYRLGGGGGAVVAGGGVPPGTR